MDWEWLDEMDKNLLYIYAKSLTGKNGRSRYSELYTALNSGNVQASEATEDFKEAEAAKRTAFYIIWFVYRYVLDCDTLEKALEYTDENILKKYKLVSFFKKRRIYIGIYGVNEIYLYNYKGGDLEIVLDILYNRYDFFEQLKCFVKHTEGSSKTTRARCINTLNECIQIAKDAQVYNAKQKAFLDECFFKGQF